MKNYIIAILMLLSGVVFGQENGCYIDKSNYSGLNLYSEALSDTVCLTMSQMQTLRFDENTDSRDDEFKVIGYALYPLYGFQSDETFDIQIKAIREYLATLDHFYVCVVKMMHPDRIEYYNIVHLPDSGDFNGFSSITEAAIEQDMNSAMESGFSYFKVNAIAELVGFKYLLDLLEDVRQNQFNPHMLVEGGFDKYELPVGYSISETGELLQQEQGGMEIYDVATVSLEGVSLASELIASSEFSSSVNLDYYVAISTNDHLDKLSEIDELFEQSTKKIKMWFHFENTSEGQYFYFKSDNNLSLSEAEQILEEEYYRIISLHVEQIELPDEDDYGGNSTRMSGGCEVSWQLGKTCVLPYINEYLPQSIGVGSAIAHAHAGAGAGLLDGLLGTIEFAYNSSGSLLSGIWKGIKYLAKPQVLYDIVKAKVMSVTWESCVKKLKSTYTNARKFLKDSWEDLEQAYNTTVEVIKSLSGTDIHVLMEGVYRGMKVWLGDMFDYLIAKSNEFAADMGYYVGVFAFDVILAYFTAGISTAGSAAKAGSSINKIINLVKSFGKGMDKISGQISAYLIEGMKTTAGKAAKFKCWLTGGCFVKDTPVLMANNKYNLSFGNTAKAMAVAASMPIVAVPIQEVQLLDYAVAHKTVNATYGLTASVDDDTYLGLTEDPYTSDQQRERDEYEINDKDWNEVVFEEIHGGSTAKLALHNDWINQKGYQVDAVVEMNLPEQGISGPFRITSIKHIIPQKKPADDDEADEYDYRPVTGLFIHEASDVWKIKFDNGEELGVTHKHPIYSATKGDWEHAGELEIGEEVLTKSGGAKVIFKEKDKFQEVYNLEVKDYHNFLVSASGIVVHNTALCDKYVKNYLKDKGIKNTHLLKSGHKHTYDGPNKDYYKQKYGKDKIEICYDDLGFPDFTDYVEKFLDLNGNEITSIVDIGPFEGSNANDYKKANDWLIAQTGDQNMKFPRTINGVKYTWHHHQDGKTMMLVPSDINHNAYGSKDAATHLGGKTIANKGAADVFPSYQDTQARYRKLCK